MSQIATASLVLLLLFPLTAARAEEPDLKSLQKALVAGIEAFDRIELNADGKPSELNVELGKMPVGEYRSGDDVLISAGEGKWTWERRFPDGKVARRMPLAGDQFNGEATGFHENGQISFKATYAGGLLEGDAIQFDEAGKEISRRTFKEGKPIKKP